MTVQELIEHLQHQDPEAEIRIAYQPSYPLAGVLGNVITDEEIAIEEVERDLEDVPEEDIELTRDEMVEEAGRGNFVWFAVGSAPYDESPYAPKAAWESI